MRKKLRTIKTILTLLLLLVTIIAVFASCSSAALNRKILLYNEDYIYYYYNIDDVYKLNASCVRSVQ